MREGRLPWCEKERVEDKGSSRERGSLDATGASVCLEVGKDSLEILFPFQRERKETGTTKKESVCAFPRDAGGDEEGKSLSCYISHYIN